MKTYHFCVIARRAQFFAPDVAIFNGTKRHPGTKFGETARSGMRPTCTPSPCTSCLVFPYKTAGRSKQIRLLLPFLPPEGVPAQPPCSAAFQRSCVLHRAFSYDPSAHSADRIPARTEKLPRRAAARRRFRLSKKSGTVKISQQIRNVLRNRKIGFCVPYFRSSLPILSLRGGRVRPTRQS